MPSQGINIHLFSGRRSLYCVYPYQQRPKSTFACLIRASGTKAGYSRITAGNKMIFPEGYGKSTGYPKKLSSFRLPFCKSACYLMKTITEIYFTMPNLDLSICFISVSVRIDFLFKFPEKRTPELFKKELKMVYQ